MGHFCSEPLWEIWDKYNQIKKKNGDSMKSFYVNSKELFDKKKNPKMSLSVKDILGNEKIKKHYIKGVRE